MDLPLIQRKVSLISFLRSEDRGVPFLLKRKDSLPTVTSKDLLEESLL